jgi:hypothetical protein
VSRAVAEELYLEIYRGLWIMVVKIESAHHELVYHVMSDVRRAYLGHEITRVSMITRTAPHVMQRIRVGVG